MTQPQTPIPARRAKKRPAVNTRQHRLRLDEPPPAARPPRQPRRVARFVTGEDRLFHGDTPLATYLEETGEKLPLLIHQVLASHDWTPFTARYQAGGRAPLHPRRMLGLIYLGISLGQTSLRALERLARFDLRAQFVAGGLTPDHSTLGAFIRLHAVDLTGAAFEAFTGALLRLAQVNTQVVAIDGSVVEAMASRVGVLKAEAAQAAAEAAAEAAAAGDAQARSTHGAPV